MTNALNFKADYSDQAGLFNPAHVSTPITMIGCGGIGASVLPILLTMGFQEFVLWDGDSVEPRNVTTNLIFRPQDVYRPKVVRVKEHLAEYGGSDVTVTTHQEAYAGQEPLSGIVISGVDSMAARRSIWPHLADNTEVPLYFDGRIGGLQTTLLAFPPFGPAQIRRYETYYLGSDENVAPLQCTQRTIIYPATTLGGFMAEYLRRWSQGNVADVPFMTELHFGDKKPLFQTLI